MELVINNITKNYGKYTAVNQLSLKLTNGVYGLIGVNGAGKTTLMRMICTLLKPSEGSITYNGVDILTMDKEYRDIIGYLPQEFGYYPDFTVKEYLKYIATIKGLKRNITNKRVITLIKQVGLEKESNKKMKKLSGGMKRRVGIAQAMLNDPKILILDEPTAGLDPNERIRFRNLISELSKDRLVLLSTHIASDIEYIANQIILMKSGECMQSGTMDELIVSMNEKVWECLVNKEEVELAMKQYKISNLKTIPGGAELRIISHEKPYDNAIEKVATLEDVFLHYFGEKAGE